MHNDTSTPSRTRAILTGPDSGNPNKFASKIVRKKVF
jgi:hypothetical protein